MLYNNTRLQQLAVTLDCSEIYRGSNQCWNASGFSIKLNFIRVLIRPNNWYCTCKCSSFLREFTAARWLHKRLPNSALRTSASAVHQHITRPTHQFGLPYINANSRFRIRKSKVFPRQLVRYLHTNVNIYISTSTSQRGQPNDMSCPGDFCKSN